MAVRKLITPSVSGADWDTHIYKWNQYRMLFLPQGTLQLGYSRVWFRLRRPSGLFGDGTGKD